VNTIERARMHVFEMILTNFHLSDNNPLSWLYEKDFLTTQKKPEPIQSAEMLDSGNREQTNERNGCIV
jgi:hypothetical protein